MEKKTPKNKKEYDVIFKTQFELVTHHLTEEEYFEYYQIASDPTFELYKPTPDTFTRYSTKNDSDFSDDLLF